MVLSFLKANLVIYYMNNTDVVIVMGFRDLIFYRQRYVFIVNKTVLEVKMLNRLTCV